MIGRRSFLKKAVAVPFMASGSRAVAQGLVQPIGLQLYTVRAELENNFDRTLANVAAIGYKEVEFAGYVGRSPQQIRAALQASGLTGVSGHVSFAALGDRWPESVEVARLIGQKYLVVVAIDQASRVQPDGWKRAAERLNRAGEVCRAAGLQLGYHNHVFEFASLQGGAKPYDILLELTDPSLVTMQMDICWFTAAGQDPGAYLKRYPGRYSSAHVKDLKRRPIWTEPIGVDHQSSVLHQDLTDVGQGVIDWRTILGQCWAAGIRHYYVEHDTPSVGLESAERSFRYVAAVRFR